MNWKSIKQWFCQKDVGNPGGSVANWRCLTGGKRVAQGVHLITGFHGEMYISPLRIPEYQNLANWGHSMSVALAWVNAMYHPWSWTDAIFGMGHMTCPVAMALGKDYNECMWRLNNERYNSSSVSTHSATSTWYVLYPGGCDPQTEDPLPSAGGQLFDIY
jgi:hypothetical protein